MPQEVELKLAIAPQAVPHLLQHPVLAAAGEPRVRTLDNIYFDTPDLHLWRHRIALRLRRAGQEWVQTLKAADEASGGLASRREWETPSDGRQLDFSVIDDPDLRAWLQRPKVAQRLEPAFETRFTRRTWLITTPAGARIEVALDEGTVSGGGRNEALCEVELELLQGRPAALFHLALALAETLPLRPVQASKAERGYRLFRGAAPQPLRAELPRLRLGDSPRHAFRALALACLSAYIANEEGDRLSRDPEFVHQMRVALRRLRSALRLFRDSLPAEFVANFTPALGDLARRLGKVRDWDVFCATTLPRLPCDAATGRVLAAAATRLRGHARQALTRHLNTPAHAQRLLAFSAALHTLGEPAAAGPDGAAAPTDLRTFAARRLRRRHRALVARLAPLPAQDPVALHALRIQAKRTRYACDGFAPLFDDKATACYTAALNALQDALGAWNDVAVAHDLLARCVARQPSLATAAAALEAARAAQAARLATDVAAAAHGLLDTRPPWPKD